MDPRIERLERAVRDARRLAAASLVLPLLLALLALAAPRRESGAGGDGGILRVRGIVVEDEAGRERILIGAPIPAAKNRVRTDLDRVRATWGKRFPPEYIDLYRGYRHDTNGIVVLDEQGFDRIALGSPAPDPNTGKRIGPGTGLMVCDDEGFERGGFGVVDVGGVDRVVLGLDSSDGSEGAALFVDDAGAAGVMVRERDRAAFLGNDLRDPAGPSSPFGLLLSRQTEEVHRLAVEPGSNGK